MKRMRLILSSFIFLFLWASLALVALDPGKKITQYKIKVWNMESGLPGNSVFAVQQTHDGYLWIGTQDGLVRFDGIGFQLYNRGEIPQLKDNEIRALCEDHNRTLWIGTTSGGLTFYKEGEFTPYPIEKHKFLFKISAIREDRWGNLWIGSFKEGLTCLSGGKFTTYTTKEDLPHNEVNSIHKDENHDLWIVTTAGIVKLLEPGTFKLYVSQEMLAHRMETCLYDGETEELWIGTGDGYLFCLKNGIVKPYGEKEGILYPTVNCLYRDGEKNLWIGTDGGGLTRMIDGVSSTLAASDGLAAGSVTSIYEDREDSLWVGTLDGGLHRLRDGKFTVYTTREGLSHDFINCIYENRAGDLLIGTKQGLNILKPTNSQKLLQGVQGGGFLEKSPPGNSVTSLFEDLSGRLWIGTYGGLYRLEDGKLKTFEKHVLSDNSITCIQGDSKGNIWIGTEEGLNRFDGTGNRFTGFLLERNIGFVFEDSRGNLWIGTDEGLLPPAARGAFLKNRPRRYGPPKKLLFNEAGMKDKFRCAFEDKEGALWFGTDSGLIRLKGEKTTLYDLQGGLIENYVYSILEDEQGYLWLAGRNGISRVSKKELADFATGKIQRVNPASYNEKDGLKSRWCSGEGCRTRDGRFWFPTSVGAAVIDPADIRKNKIPPALIIEKLIVDDQPINIRAREKKPLVLAPGKRRLEFYYTGASFINPGKINFKIKLEGYDRDWVDMGNARTTTYTQLSPKHYTFRVIAANPDGVKNEKGASFSFDLKPFFWQTTWFYLLIVLFVVLAVFSFYRFRVGQLKRREKELKVLVKQSTKVIEAKKQQLEIQTVQLKDQSEKLKEMDKVKSRFFANISHEFRTPLTLIMGPLEQMIAETLDKKQKKQLNLMLRNSQRLLGLINQLLELSKFESGKAKLQTARQNIIPFLKGITASFEVLTNQSEVDLTFHAEEEDITLYFDPEKIEDVMSNLLINAVKFTPRGSKVTVTAKRIAAKEESSPGSLEISVCDMGPGIPRNQVVHIFDRFYQSDSTYEHHRKGSGIGLAIAKELVVLHHGKIEVHSREGQNSGTEFTIELPLGDSHLKPAEIVDLPATIIHRPPPPGIHEDFIDTQQEPEPPAPLKQDEKEIILVVEDSADVRDYIRGSLEPHYAVAEASGGQEGIQKAKKIIPDLIISDIMMPGTDGYALCKTLKNDIITSHIPVMLLTAKASEESIVRGLETGADDYITKPFNTKIMMARIKNLIDLRRQLQLNINREMVLQPSEISVSEIDKEFIKELREVINENLPDPDFNVEQMAKKLYMNRATVYRKVLALTGETPTEFIQSSRLKRGAELLKSNFGTVLEVAFEVGFSSANYFSKCFKKKFHQLPSTYQASESSSSDGEAVARDPGL